jgi:DNA-binding NtrC family response regulator
MRSIKILAVDDEPDVESLLTQSFRKHIRSGEFEFAFAYDGMEALKRVEEQRDLDVILLDINMPVMDGLTFLAQLNESGSDLLVIMVSAYGDMSNIRLSMNRGAYDFIMKPVDMTDLGQPSKRRLQRYDGIGYSRSRKASPSALPPQSFSLLFTEDGRYSVKPR